MTDKGYYQEKESCWFPSTGDMNSMSVYDKIQRRKVTRIRNINERLIGRLVSWGCFKKRWCNSWELLSLSCEVASKLIQLEVHAYPLT